MEREDLLKMIGMYKKMVSDLQEQNMIYQVMISNSSAEKEKLNARINELTEEQHSI